MKPRSKNSLFDNINAALGAARVLGAISGTHPLEILRFALMRGTEAAVPAVKRKAGRPRSTNWGGKRPGSGRKVAKKRRGKKVP